MLKHLMSGASLLALALREKDSEGNDIDPKIALREQIAKGNLPENEKLVEKEKDDDGQENKEGEEGEEGDKEENDEGDGEKDEEELTPEQIKEKEANEKIVAKAKRKEDRVQKRIDELTASKNAAETEVAKLKAQLEANPDQKLTTEEIDTRAKAIADERIAKKELEDLNKRFKLDCDKLQISATKADKDFNNKIDDIAEQFGPIPSFMIGVLSDMENGGEVLAFIANDDEVAESIWSKSPATMTRKLIEISNKLIEAKKPPKKQISKVPDPGKPVNGSRTNGLTVITEADTKNMEVYAAKRRAQQEERRKQGR